MCAILNFFKAEFMRSKIAAGFHSGNPAAINEVLCG